MSVPVNRQPTGTIEIADLPYFLAKDETGNATWRPMRIQTQEGDPTVPRRFRWNDWSRGMGDSRGVFRGSVEYAENAFLPLGRILPGPKVTEIALGLDGVVNDILEVTVPAHRVLVCGGTKVEEINPATDAIADTETLSGTLMSMALWKGDQVVVAAGDSVDYYIREADGDYVQNSISKKARAFGRGTDNTLVRGFANTWSRCDAQNVTSVDNWTTDYPIGNDFGMVNQVGAYNRWDYVLKDDGFYSFNEDADSNESSLIGDLESWPSPDNRYWFPWAAHLFVCTRAALYRFIQQGAARPVGIENAALNESELVDTYPTAGVAFGDYGYEARTNGTSTWIVMFRRSMDGDANMGSPYTPVSVIDKFTGECRVMRIITRTATPEVWYGAEQEVRYFNVSPDGRPSVYRDSGSLKVDFAPTDLGSPGTLKYFRGLEIIGRNAASGRSIQMAASMDDGSFNNVGTAVTALTNGYVERFWTPATNDSGRVLQLRATLLLNSTSVAPEIRDLFVNFEERPIMVEGAVFALRFRDHDSEGDVADRRTALEQRQAFEALLEAGPIEIIDPWGLTKYVALSRYEGDVRFWYRGDEPQFDIAVAMRVLEYA